MMRLTYLAMGRHLHGGEALEVGDVRGGSVGGRRGIGTNGRRNGDRSSDWDPDSRVRFGVGTNTTISTKQEQNTVCSRLT